MKSSMYSLRDSKVGTFAPPYYFRSDGEAIRALESTVNETDARRQTNISKYPHDFHLYHIGEFDHEKAEITQEKPRLVVCADTLVKPVNGKVDK